MTIQTIAKTIAVHGATGSQSAPVATRLAAAGHDVRPLSRSTGVDLLDRASLEAAYAGVDSVVLQLPLVYDERALVMADNAAVAAELAGVPHLVINTSALLPAQPVGVPFIDARHAAAAAAVATVTVLQPTLYLENLTGAWMTPHLLDGVLSYPLPGQIPIPWVATADVAVAVERAIAREVAGWFALPGVAVTGDEIADAIGAVCARPMRWHTISADEYGEMLRPHLGDHAADGVAAIYRVQAASPPGPAPDPAPAHAALDWLPRLASAWAAQEPAFAPTVGAAPCP
jgi:uncharacterized protein YbjT (DUF2867 family)